MNLLDENYKFDAITRPKMFKSHALDTITPKIHLHLFDAVIHMREYDKPQLVKVIKSLAALTFQYNDIEIEWNDKQETLKQQQADQIHIFKRDKKLENKAYEMLINYGLAPISSLFEYKTLYDQSKENAAKLNYFLLESNQSDPLQFSNKIIPQLREQGWIITMDPIYRYQIVEDTIDDWYSTVEEDNSNSNWFNLELGIILNGEKINLLPVHQQLLQNLQTSKTKSFSSLEPVLAKLPDGRFLPLPSERIQSIVNVLIELYDGKSLSEDDLLRLSKLHAARLMELEAATGAVRLRWYGGEKLKNLRKN